MGFDGKRVLAFETRRAAETAELIRRNGGVPFVAPSVVELRNEANSEAREFAAALSRGEFDMVIFLTGVGIRHLLAVLPPDTGFVDDLRRVTVVARGPKPMAVLREFGVGAVAVPEPNTWREILHVVELRPERRIGVQEYGRPAKELLEGLRGMGKEAIPVPVYRYGLPEDTGPLREAAARLERGEVDIALFTTSQQVVHLFEVAPDVGPALRRTTVASIGPTTSETLRDYGIEPAFEPSHAKLGLLVKAAAEHPS